MRRLALIVVAALTLLAPTFLVGSAQADGRSHGHRQHGLGHRGGDHFRQHQFDRQHSHRRPDHGGFRRHGHFVHPGFHGPRFVTPYPGWVRTPGHWVWDGWSWVWVTGYWAR
jgi:hypothetical protein